MEQNAKTYQAKDGYIHRKVAGADVLVAIGGNVADFNGYIELNASAAFLWDQLKTPVTAEALASALEKQFEVSSEQAVEDTLAFLQALQNHKMVEVC